MLRKTLFAFGILVTSCVTTPETDRRALKLIPDSQMNTLGEQAYNELSSTEPVSKNQNFLAVVNDVGKRIAAASNADFKWEFKVFDKNDTVNAFCLPGGKIGVYTGILPIAKDEAGLAAVLGHEVAHATAHHAAERLSQALIVNLGLTLADVSLQNQRYRQVILAGIGLGAQIGVMLPYSRLHEKEADKIGVIYMARAGYDPEEALKFWQRMAEKADGPKVPEFLSTHPSTSTRIIELREFIETAKTIYKKSNKQKNEPIQL